MVQTNYSIHYQDGSNSTLASSVTGDPLICKGAIKHQQTLTAAEPSNGYTLRVSFTRL